MRSALCLLVSALAYIGPAVSTSETPRSCYYYSEVNTNHATCNDAPGVVCTKGCRGPFVVAHKCRPDNDPKAEYTTQTCNAGFGGDSATTKYCKTNDYGNFLCTGETPGHANCYGCTTPPTSTA